MPGSYVLSLDQGTSSSRALVVDSLGSVVAAVAREFPQIYPRPGWVEHDPEAIWTSQIEAAHVAIASAGISVAQIGAIGIANQRETTIVWERTSGRPLMNAIVWQCRRTADACAELRAAGVEPLLRERTGLLLDAYFSGTKIAWILDNVPGARRRAEAGELAFGTVDSWLLHRLTGGRVHATDRTNASRTLLYNLAADRWDSELCRLLRVPEAMLPEVRPSAAWFGESEPSLFGRALPIGGMAGDQQAALFGQACNAAGATKNTYGTGCFVLQYTGGAVPALSPGLIATAAAGATTAPAFALEGSIFIAGAAVQWLRDGLALIKSAAEIEALAASVADTGGVHFVPAFVGLGAPYWDSKARGLISGITRGTTAAHLARATLEAIAFQTRDVLELFEQGQQRRIPELRVDGGAAENDLLLQIQADLLGRPVVRPVVRETTALGAAYLAGISAGIWRDASATAALWRVDRRFEPRISEPERERRYAEWQGAVARTRAAESA
ncbi:MAG TPA: glycerol kinase GlpK [Dehalococcoidia bacterium]|nr:glycerol kinase GlpK [Dehalococcoidia bacterium]